MFKKADFILAAILIIVGIASSLIVSLNGSVGNKVNITVDGELYGVYSLNTDTTIEIKNDGNTNTVTIKNGTAYMSDSSCKNQICVQHAPISNTNESIICLPNKVVVSIVGNGGDGYDEISN